MARKSKNVFHSSTSEINQSRFFIKDCRQESNERIQKFKETEDSRYIYQNKLEKPCFQYDMTYGGCKRFSWKSNF